MHDDSSTTALMPLASVGKEWNELLKSASEAPYFKALESTLVAERGSYNVHPSAAETFAALQRTAFHSVRVVILGQDPYHGPGQAHGLAFSVPEGIPLPPSLRNIFKELKRDLAIEAPAKGDLGPWAEQGVLLLNTTLTVREGEAGSHSGKGWERLTDTIISTLSERRNGLIFLLWGRHAQQKAALIDARKHHLLQAPHPSPLSAHRGFIGCGHFSQVNALLREQGQEPIDWRIP